MKRLAALPLVFIALIGGCGGDDADSGDTASTQASTVPDERVGASAVTPKPGAYAGLECPNNPGCSSYENAREGNERYPGFVESCRDGHPTAYAKYGISFRHVCFTLDSQGNVENFNFGGAKIVDSAPVSGGAFPETCKGEWCIEGEWTGTERVSGQVRKGADAPFTKYRYQAEWIND